MGRFTISLDDDLAREFDELIARRGYQNRSEAIRDLLRGHLESARQSTATGDYCVANLSYVYNHHERDLAERLTELQHGHHDLTVATLHAHLDHDNCLEIIAMRGKAAVLKELADKLIAVKGIQHGQLTMSHTG